jgi:hypothetical protein
MNVLIDLSLINGYCELTIYGYAQIDSLPFAKDTYQKATLCTMKGFGVSKNLLS